MDMCLLSASCIIRSIQFEVTIEAEKDTDLWIIPAETYNFSGGFRFYDVVVNDRALIERAYACGMDYKKIITIFL